MWNYITKRMAIYLHVLCINLLSHKFIFKSLLEVLKLKIITDTKLKIVIML